MTDERYLVTGARGMLGQAVTAELLLRGCVVTPTDLPETDLTDEAAAERLFNAVRPTRVIHCAAYTAVDRAEADIETCRRVNVDMPTVVARACARADAAMLLVSTDFVFGGTIVPPVSSRPGQADTGEAAPAGAPVAVPARRPYRESDTPRPLSVYGQTKLDGEHAVAASLDRHQIVRTAWLYGPGKRNFVSAMLERLWRGERLRVVDDQTGSPTYTLDLASALADLCGAGPDSPADASSATGIFHLVNAGQTTWCGLTRRAAELAGLDPQDVEPIPTSGYPTPARRPAWSVLDCSRAWSLCLTPMRRWDEALAEYVAILARERSA